MGKVFLSFLGTNQYVPCNYYYGNKKVDNVHYVQEALIKIFCSNYTSNDRIIIFLTDAARKINWKSGNNSNSLKSRLENLNLDAIIEDVSIPIGNTEKEIWDIFSIIYEKINQDDEVIFDITHAFRSIPMLGIVLLNYARFLKNMRVKGIYYGAFEVLGPKDKVLNIDIKKRNAPIFGLTSFDTLQQWSIAAENFVDYGNTDKISRLVSNDVTPILRKNSKNRQAINASQFSRALNKVSSYFSTARGNKIINGKDFIYLKNNIRNLELSNFISKPLAPLKEKIIDKIEPYVENNILNGFKAVEWCIDNKLIQQGITLLQETIITFILSDMKIAWDNVPNRDVVSYSVKVFCRKINEDKWPDKLKNNKKLTKEIMSNSNFKLLAKYFEQLREFRNDINHGGYLKSAKKNPGSFEAKLKEVYNNVKQIVFGDNS